LPLSGRAGQTVRANDGDASALQVTSTSGRHRFGGAPRHRPLIPDLVSQTPWRFPGQGFGRVSFRWTSVRGSASVGPVCGDAAAM